MNKFNQVSSDDHQMSLVGDAYVQTVGMSRGWVCAEGSGYVQGWVCAEGSE